MQPTALPNSLAESSVESTHAVVRISEVTDRLDITPYGLPSTATSGRAVRGKPVLSN